MPVSSRSPRCFDCWGYDMDIAQKMSYSLHFGSRHVSLALYEFCNVNLFFAQPPRSNDNITTSRWPLKHRSRNNKPIKRLQDNTENNRVSDTMKK